MADGVEGGTEPPRPEEVDVAQQMTLVQRAHLEAGGSDRCTGGPVTTLVLDADDFHEVTDRLGREHADRVLLELADRLQDRLCRCGVTTHLSHDLLGISCIGLVGDQHLDADVSSALAQPLDLCDGLIEVRAG